MQIPELIETWRIAKSIGWTTDKTTRLFRGMGIGGRVQGRRDTYVTREFFEAKLPQIYLLFVRKYEAGELLSKRGGRRNRLQQAQ
jgi:hypothetical protein